MVGKREDGGRPNEQKTVNQGLHFRGTGRESSFKEDSWFSGMCLTLVRLVVPGTESEVSSPLPVNSPEE